MASSITKSVTTVLVTSFILWYLLRRTNLGIGYTSDMLAIPQYFGAGEGLKSAGRYIMK